MSSKMGRERWRQTDYSANQSEGVTRPGGKRRIRSRAFRISFPAKVVLGGNAPGRGFHFRGSLRDETWGSLFRNGANVYVQMLPTGAGIYNRCAQDDSFAWCGLGTA